MTSSLAIGEFARATQLSVKALRNYHQLGLLEPAEVDASSSYRRYTVEQIPTAQIIRRFRNLDMPLELIGAVLGADDPSARSQLISQHLARMERELVQTQAAVASLRSLLDGPPPTLDIEHRREAETMAAVISASVTSEDLAAWFSGASGELYATVDAQGVNADGPAGAIISNRFFEDEVGEITVFIPTAGAVRPIGRVAAGTIPAVDLAVITHRGSHDDVDRAYGALASYVSVQALGVDGPIRERYVVGRRDTPDVGRWVTEIGWPIFDTGPTGT